MKEKSETASAQRRRLALGDNITEQEDVNDLISGEGAVQESAEGGTFLSSSEEGVLLAKHDGYEGTSLSRLVDRTKQYFQRTQLLVTVHTFHSLAPCASSPRPLRYNAIFIHQVRTSTPEKAPFFTPDYRTTSIKSPGIQITMKLI